MAKGLVACAVAAAFVAGCFGEEGPQYPYCAAFLYENRTPDNVLAFMTMIPDVSEWAGLPATSNVSSQIRVGRTGYGMLIGVYADEYDVVVEWGAEAGYSRLKVFPIPASWLVISFKNDSIEFYYQDASEGWEKNPCHTSSSWFWE